MPIIIDTFEQNSEEWFKARAGNPGASNIDKIITPTGIISKSRDDYMRQLTGECVTGKAEDGYQSQFMINGKEREAIARTLFEMIHGMEAKQVGIVYKDKKKLFHCCPDGLPGEAVLELKNPMMKTHVRYLLENKLPNDYFGQTQMELYVCERELLYFMSHYPGLPPFILEVGRDEPYIAKLEKALNDFVAELAAMVKRIKEMK